MFESLKIILIFLVLLYMTIICTYRLWSTIDGDYENGRQMVDITSLLKSFIDVRQVKIRLSIWVRRGSVKVHDCESTPFRFSYRLFVFLFFLALSDAFLILKFIKKLAKTIDQKLQNLQIMRMYFFVTSTCRFRTFIGKEWGSSARIATASQDSSSCHSFICVTYKLKKSVFLCLRSSIFIGFF
jgi:hypothetical protein